MLENPGLRLEQAANGGTRQTRCRIARKPAMGEIDQPPANYPYRTDPRNVRQRQIERENVKKLSLKPQVIFLKSIIFVLKKSVIKRRLR